MLLEVTSNEMEQIQELQETELGLIKAQTEDEFLTKIGAKDHEIEWEPLIVNEPIKRSSSFVCAEYHKPPVSRQKPKTVPVGAWTCQSQACRQLCMLPRFGPRQFFINNQNIHEKTTQYLRNPSTQAIGLCHQPKVVDSL